jgi:hypothetical protein
MAKFRETLWFKKGVQDAEAADAADPTDVMATAAVDMLPIEDRYDDRAETVNRADSVEFGVRTGITAYLEKLPPAPPPLLDDEDGVNEVLLVKDLKAGRRRVLAAIGAGAALVLAVVLVMVATS